jgi:hypothetical protein
MYSRLASRLGATALSKRLRRTSHSSHSSSSPSAAPASAAPWRAGRRITLKVRPSSPSPSTPSSSDAVSQPDPSSSSSSSLPPASARPSAPTAGARRCGAMTLNPGDGLASAAAAPAAGAAAGTAAPAAAGPAAASSRRFSITTGAGAGAPLRRTSSAYLLLAVASRYFASDMNLRRVSGSYHTRCVGAAAAEASCALRASNQSLVTGGRPATLRLRL